MAPYPLDPAAPAVDLAGSAPLPLDTPPPPLDPNEDAERQKQAKREAFLALARKRWQVVDEAESTLRAEMLADLQFLQPGGQWAKELKETRKANGDPCLEVDRLTGAIKQVNNQQRQTRPAIQVSPVDSGSDPKTAEVLQGLVRHIEVQSDADVAYDTAGEHQAKMGRGYLRVIAEYEDETSFNQQLRIRRIRNPFSVYLDPTGTQFDGSDARYGFIVQDIPKDEYVARFGAESLQYTLSEFSGIGNNATADWLPEGRIRVAEYFYRDDVEMALIETPGGGTLKVVPGQVPPGVRSRRVEVRKVYWALINGAEILEGNEDRTEGREWPGQYIPIVPVLGDETDINGVVDYQGMVRKAKDVERSGSYWRSYITGQIALSSRVPYVVAEGQLEGHEKKWALANRVAFPYLEYKPVTMGDKFAPPPQRDRSEPPIQAATIALQQNDNDFRQVTGFVDVQASEKKSETSGRAILARQHQSELGNSNLIDNLGRSIRHVGRILVDLIPKIYDVPRVVRILGLDDQPKAVMVHAGGQPQAQLPEGVEAIYDLSVGRYDVTVSVGPSHQSMRAEAVDSMLQLLQAVPAVGPAIMDVVVGNMDWPGAKQISERLKKLLPAELRDGQADDAPIPPAAQQKLAQSAALIEQMTARLNQLADERNAKLIELESKERIATMQIQADLVKTEATLSAQNAQTLLGEQMAAVRQRLDHLTDIYQAERQSAADLAAGQPPAAPPQSAGQPALPQETMNA